MDWKLVAGAVAIWFFFFRKGGAGCASCDGCTSPCSGKTANAGGSVATALGGNSPAFTSGAEVPGWNQARPRPLVMQAPSPSTRTPGGGLQGDSTQVPVGLSKMATTAQVVPDYHQTEAAFSAASAKVSAGGDPLVEYGLIGLSDAQTAQLAQGAASKISALGRMRFM